MDTLIKLADIAPSPDSESLFITTYSPFGPEGIWRSAGDPLGKYWQRLLTMDTITDAVILRLSASYSDDSTMYAAEAGGNLMAVSHNRGNTWQWCSTPEPVIDMVVYNEETVYIALPEGYISKTIDSAWIWQDLVDTGLSEINMLAVAPDGTILVGGRNGDVAYSTDGGDSFTRIYKAVDGGDVQVTADVDFDENRIIYVATDTPDSGIWRWMIDSSDEWEQIDRSITWLGGGQCISGLAMGLEGTLYALRSEPASVNSGGMMRSLNPLALVPSIIEFDLVNQGLPDGTTFDPAVVFANALPYLRLSEGTGQNELWSIDTANQIIYRFRDTLCKLGPKLDAPADRAIIPLDPCNCHITSLALYMEKLAGATRYEASIYLDPSGTQGVWSGSSDDSEVDDFDAIIIHVDSTGLAQLSSGNTYYWQARAIEPIKSQWSDTWLFAPALGDVQQSSLTSPNGVSPSVGATNVPIRPAFTWHQVAGATGYEFMLAKDSGFTDVVVAITGDNVLTSTAWGCDRDLDYSTTYFWKMRAVSVTSYSEWVTNVFGVETAPTPSPSIPQVPLIPPPPVEPVSTIPSYLLWIMIGTGIVLAAAVIILIHGTRY